MFQHIKQNYESGTIENPQIQIFRAFIFFLISYKSIFDKKKRILICEKSNIEVTFYLRQPKLR